MPDINMQVFEEVKRNQLATEIDIQTQVALDDYQVQLADIANPTKSQDNVVIDRHGEFLPHWNESLDFDTWVKMSMEIAGKRILMLRGNSTVGSASNGIDTFEFFDDFEDNDISDYTQSTADAYTVSNGIVTRAYSGISSQYIYRTFSFPTKPFIAEMIFNPVTGSDPGNWMRLGSGQIMGGTGGYSAKYTVSNNGYSSTGSSASITNTLRTMGIIVKTNIVELYDSTVGSTPVLTKAGATVSLDSEIGIWSNVQGGTYREIRVRKYTATEPAWLADGEEQNIAVALKSLGRAG